MSLLGLVIGGIYIGAGLFCFFLGGLLYQLFEYQRRNPGSVFGHKLIPVLSLFLAAIAFFASTFILSRYLQIFFACVSILPAIVYFLACFQDRFPNRGRSWILIGDLTYATYLLHFPMQILFQIAFVSNGRFNPLNNGILILYILTTYAISYIAYRDFELPAKNFFRNRLRS
jgi:peptidoglycan/LPS O-acetylase OafA/YrhL